MNKAVFPTDTSQQLHLRCIHCMGELVSTHTECPHCGHPDQNHYPHPLYLSPHTLLKGQYLLGRVLGQGGFGITYMGLDLCLNKRVAIKEYLPSSLALRELDSKNVIPLHNQAEALQKGLDSFINEAQNLALFEHPNIVRVLNYFEEYQTAYMVMEYLEGDSPARRLCERGGTLNVEEALDIVLPILEALDTIHAKQVFHLDVSAHNILLTQHDVPILIDFGAARSVSVMAEHTRSMTLVLKPGYSPLEQYSDQGNIGPWTDIYACAALLHLLLKGQLPPAATERWQQDTLQNEAFIDPQHERAHTIHCALKKALAVHIQQRWQNVTEFRDALLAPSAPSRLRPVLIAVLLSSALLSGSYHLWRESLLSPLLAKASTPTETLISVPSNLPISPSTELDVASPVTDTLASDNSTNVPSSPTLQAAALNYWLQFAEDNTQTGEFDTAFQTYQAILRIEPEQQAALKGLESLAQRRLNEAQTLYEKAQNQQKKQQDIEKLLKQSEAQLAAHKLTSPEQDNAYLSYQKLLTLAAKDARVMRLPDRIAESYVALAQEAQIPQQRELIQKGLSIQPRHPRLLALQQSLNNTQARNVPAPTVEVAYSPPEPPQLTEPQNPPLQMADWLQQGQQALAQNQLESAYESYQKVLVRDNQHPQAQQGLQRIAARYVQQARTQQAAGQLAESLVLVGRGLGVLAQYPELLQLQQELREQLNKSTQVEAAQNNSEPFLLTPSF